MKCVGLSIASLALIILYPTQSSPTDQRAWLSGNSIYPISASREAGWIAPVRGICVRYSEGRAEPRHYTTNRQEAFQIHRARISQSTLQEPLEVPETLLRSSPCQNYFHNHTKTLFAFHTFTHPWLYGGTFQKPPDRWWCYGSDCYRNVCFSIPVL